MADTTRIHLHGATLAGLAAAIRLARAGHQVSLDPAGPLGGRAAGRQLAVDHADVLVDDLEPVLTLPAAWRDLMKKSGRPLAGALNMHHLELVPAPPAVHHFADGTELVLPDDRAGQLASLRAVLGDAAALRWTSLLDEVDDVWQALRMTGVERPFPSGGPDPARARRLWRGRTLAHLARDLREPHLAGMLLSAGWRAGAGDPERAPAWLATRWTLPRTFGRWHLTTSPGSEDEEPRRALALNAMVTLLTDRLVERGVELEASDPLAHATIEACAPAPAARAGGWWSRLAGRPRHPTPVRPPTVTHDLHTELAPVEGITESVFHTSDGVVVAWQLTTDSGVLVTSHDHTRPGPPDPAHGWDLSSWDSWAGRPLLQPQQPGLPWRASAASHAGNEPWAELLSAALVTYEVHQALTGADIRPTNKANTAHRPR